MAVDHIRYDILTQDALRGVVRTVLSDAAVNGLPGEHHFFITFDPRSEGAELSPRMREQYPEEMTIVLQHQFWDLKVAEDRFEVGLSFGGAAERVVVPFVSILRFVDPSVQFGVQFEQLPADAASDDNADTPVRPPAEHKPPAEIAAVPIATPATAESKTDEPPESAQVLRLDRFRKK